MGTAELPRQLWPCSPVSESCTWTGNHAPQERAIAFYASSLLISSSLPWLAPHVSEEHLILLIVLVTSCKDYAC